MTVNLPTLEGYQQYLLTEYSNFPRGRYVSLIIIRKTESETIFRTEGSGEGLVKETVWAGLRDVHQIPFRRVMITKRKQTAVERRTGRELLRAHGMLKRPLKKGKEDGPECSLNTNAPCERCIDCFLYGFAAGGGGAQKSRVMTEDAFSIGSVAQVTGRRTFNATFDNGTMRSPIDGKPSTSISEDEFVRPEAHFLDIETLKDVKPWELQYVIGNIMRSARYGAISSRMGRIKNTIAAVVFSDCELFSNLELTHAVYDRLHPTAAEDLVFPLSDAIVAQAVQGSIEQLVQQVVSRAPVVVQGEALMQIIGETITLFRSDDHVQELLTKIDAGYDNAVGRQ